MPIITATFETRRDAELAVEHLVQEHGVERDEIIVGTEADENSVGTQVSGADQATEFEDSDEESAALNGAIIVIITVDDDELAEALQEVLEEFGCDEVNVTG